MSRSVQSDSETSTTSKPADNIRPVRPFVLIFFISLALFLLHNPIWWIVSGWCWKCFCIPFYPYFWLIGIPWPCNDVSRHALSMDMLCVLMGGVCSIILVEFILAIFIHGITIGLGKDGDYENDDYGSKQ